METSRGNRPLESGGWSTAGRAGRPKTGAKQGRNIRATDEEWRLIKRFAAVVKENRRRAERFMESYDIWETCPGYPDNLILSGLPLAEAEEEAYKMAARATNGVEYDVRPHAEG